MKALGRVAALATVLTVMAGVSACDTSPGAAALVGDYRISTEALQQAVDAALRDPQANADLGSDRAGFMRTELGRLISNRIVAMAAQAHHVTVTPSEVDRQLQAFAQQAGGQQQLVQAFGSGGVPADEVRNAVRLYVLEQKLGDALVANAPVSQAQLEQAYRQNIDQYDQVHAAHILVKDKATADRLLADVRRDPSRFGDLAARYSTDTSTKDSGGDLGFAGRGQFVAAFSQAIFAAKPGSFIEVHTQFGWHVVHVIAHTTKPLADVTSELKASILKDTRDRLLQQALTDEGRAAGIHVSPRFGRWDNVAGKVVPIGAGSDVSSPSPAA